MKQEKISLKYVGKDQTEFRKERAEIRNVGAEISKIGLEYYIIQKAS